MRITGGSFRGKKLNSIKNSCVRPSKAIVREALFSILGPGFCYNKVVADLFSGSGILALEALSRGAKSVYCVDSDKISCDLIRSNFSLLKIASDITLLEMTVSLALKHFSSLGIVFDLIFLDPPYANSELGVEAIDLAFTAGVLSTEAVAVFEHQPKINIPKSRNMSIWKQKKYGKSMLTFYKQTI